MNNNYDDIINLPHYVSKKRPQMSIEARSAQFAPFAALTGYEDAVKETARLTDRRIEIDEGLKQVLNSKLQYAIENSSINPIIEITYFLPDDRKKGGKYVEKGATCVDDSGVFGGECVVEIEPANIDLNVDGYQYVRYTATDFFGNEVNAVRKVLVETKGEESNKLTTWIGIGLGVAILSSFLLLVAWQNKEKQKNQSVL